MGLGEMDKETMVRIEQNVGELLKDYPDYTGEAGSLDVVRFARSYGFAVGNATLPDSEDGFVAIQPEPLRVNAREMSDKVIAVNRKLPDFYKRFVVAHEFGHYALGHYEGKRGFLHREHRTGKGERENEADYFAAALLMPSESFWKAYQKLMESGMERGAACRRLAARYRVPDVSAWRRVDELIVLRSGDEPAEG